MSEDSEASDFIALEKSKPTKVGLSIELEIIAK
jgi:hypothetical protein